MAKKMVSCSMWALGLVLLALIGSPVNATSCHGTILKMLPCQPFLVGSGDITMPCCHAAQGLNEIAISMPARRFICECFKQAIAALGINLDRAKQLPQLCKIDASVPIDPNIDCNTV
ncbi:hypothetical protein F0562_014417 [Nyssa sinensis]|uniref:Bifunctional inhibitor/plant lipid transfer protein/seed storage helical domain-containing protein n=1 Tax=Nyssa sinensis TaxID=561372 RepID=A0A5J4ZSW9_9ASTE|nr:hypothetical protein F0562_014417 [Nyssa sinensis]